MGVNRRLMRGYVSKPLKAASDPFSRLDHREVAAQLPERFIPNPEIIRQMGLLR
jgi:hypothetical protein